MNRRERRRNEIFNDIYKVEPSNVIGQQNVAVVYYRDYLLDKIRGFLVWENVPDEWDMEYFMRNLLFNGSLGASETKYGPIPLRGCPYGVNVYQKPNMYNIAVPNLQKKFAIGYGGIVFNLKGNYRSFLPMFNRYAYMLASADASVSVNLMNSRTPYIARAASDAAAQSFRSMMHKITVGEPAVAIGEQTDFTWDMINVKNSFVAPDIQGLKRVILQEFLSEFGIDNGREDKKERMITGEIETKKMELQTGVEFWMKNIKEQIAEYNRMFGYDIRVKHIREVMEDGRNESLQPGNMGRVNIRQFNTSLTS